MPYRSLPEDSRPAPGFYESNANALPEDSRPAAYDEGVRKAE
jgi:hypothetical protein